MGNVFMIVRIWRTALTSFVLCGVSLIYFSVDAQGAELNFPPVRIGCEKGEFPHTVCHSVQCSGASGYTPGKFLFCGDLNNDGHEDAIDGVFALGELCKNAGYSGVQNYNCRSLSY